MIDQSWLSRVVCLVGGKLRSDDLDRICQELGVEEEVLPYLLLSAKAFSHWPLAMGAFRHAVRSVIRPTQMRPEQGHAEPMENQRCELREALLQTFNPHVSDETSMTSGTAASLSLARFRRAQRDASIDPNCFITVD